MEALFLKVLNMGISAGWLILAVILCRLLLRRAPKSIRCMLWAIVAFRLCCPISVESVYSLIPSSQTLPEETITTGEFHLESGIELVDQPVNHYFIERRNYQPASSAKNTLRPMQVISIIWAAGMAALLSYGLISYFRIRKKVRVSTAMDTADANRQIYICDDIPSPFILGILKPQIYLPSNTKPEQIPYIVAHETAHLKRHDHWWKPFGFLLLSVYWFHPLVWAAYLLLCKDIELACDERVIRDMGVQERQAYSYALLANSISRRTITACPLAFGEVGVKERIKSVMDYRKPAFWLLAIAAISCVAVAVCFLTNPKQTKTEGALKPTAMEQEQNQENTEGQDLPGDDLYSDALNPEVNLSAPLGVDGASLHYADGDRIIISCSPYLMVYSKSERKMLRAVDRAAIGCEMTQGDSACEISVTDDGNIVYLHPTDAEKMFIYDIQKNQLEQIGYDSGYFTGLGSPVPIHVMDDYYIDYYQKDGKDTFTTIWGSDTVGSLVWREEILDDMEDTEDLSITSTYYPFFLSEEHRNAIQFAPSDIHDLTKIQMFVHGQMKTCDDKKALKYAETHLGKDAKKQLNPIRPFYFPMYLTRTDGTVGIIYPAIYGGASFCADGHAYLFAGATDEDESSLGKQFWELLGGWFDELWQEKIYDTSKQIQINIDEADVPTDENVSDHEYSIPETEDESILAKATSISDLFPYPHADEKENPEMFSVNVDLDGDGIEEHYYLEDLNYNGGDGSYSFHAENAEGNSLALPQDISGERRPFFLKSNKNGASILYDDSSSIYDDNNRIIAEYSRTQVEDFYKQKDSSLEELDSNSDWRIDRGTSDAASGLVVREVNGQKFLYIKYYISGLLGHSDTFGYGIVELSVDQNGHFLTKAGFLPDLGE